VSIVVLDATVSTFVNGHRDCWPSRISRIVSCSSATISGAVNDRPGRQASGRAHELATLDAALELGPICSTVLSPSIARAHRADGSLIDDGLSLQVASRKSHRGLS
jgi:hypothetical protein